MAECDIIRQIKEKYKKSYHSKLFRPLQCVIFGTVLLRPPVAIVYRKVI